MSKGVLDFSSDSFVIAHRVPSGRNKMEKRYESFESCFSDAGDGGFVELGTGQETENIGRVGRV
jgi:hypothetical protein